MKHSSRTIYVLTGLTAAFAGSPGRAADVYLNQVGFSKEGPKLAIVEAPEASAFAIVREGNEEVMLQGTLSPAEVWDPGNCRVQVADFSSLSGEGIYRLIIGDRLSDPIRVADFPYSKLAKGLARNYFLNRASVEIKTAHGGQWHRPAAHPDDHVKIHASAADKNRPEGFVLSSPKGWYDAGDYNKYIVNSGITVYSLLLLHTLHPDYVRALDLNIPESGGLLPDLLAEAKWNIDWMLSMQDPHDGGVYHKLTTLNFSGAVMPHEATEQRYVVKKSVTATYDFAATMAAASRVYRAFDTDFADRMVAAAESAYTWAQKHPEAIFTDNPEGVFTGTYGDKDSSDELGWAAMELYLTTENPAYRKQARKAARRAARIPGWSEVNTLGQYSLALAGKDANARKGILKLADKLLDEERRSAFRIPVTKNDFHWGSNGTVANKGLLLMVAYSLTKEEEYRDAAITCLDYLLGRNPLGVCFVTGFGERSPMHPHHRASEADGIDDPVPGMLSGGPNPGRQDNCPGYPESLAPALSWVDDWCSYASNEIAINWNAPAVVLAGSLDATCK